LTDENFYTKKTTPTIEATPDTVASLRCARSEGLDRNKSPMTYQAKYDWDRFGKDIDYLKLQINLAMRHKSPKNNQSNTNIRNTRSYNNIKTNNKHYDNQEDIHFDRAELKQLNTYTRGRPSMEKEVKGYSYMKRHTGVPGKSSLKGMTSARTRPSIGGTQRENVGKILHQDIQHLGNKDKSLSYEVKQLRGTSTGRGLTANIVTSYPLKVQRLEKKAQAVQSKQPKKYRFTYEVHPEKVLKSRSSIDAKLKRLNPSERIEYVDKHIKELAMKAEGFDKHCWNCFGKDLLLYPL